MFPIPWNKAYRKKDGSLTIIDDMFVDVPELEEEIDALDDRLTTAEGNITALDGRLDIVESDLDDTIQYLGNKSVILSTADGNKTVSDILTESINAIRALDISAEMPGADTILFKAFTLAYGSGSAITMTLFIPNTFTPRTNETISSLTNLSFARIGIAPSTGATIYTVQMSTTPSGNVAFSQLMSDGTVTDFLANKPSNGTTTSIALDFYKKV